MREMEQGRFEVEDIENGERYIVIRKGTGYVKTPRMDNMNAVTPSSQSHLETLHGDPVSLNDDGTYTIIMGAAVVTATKIE